MLYSTIASLVLGLASLAQAGITSPSSSSSWPVGMNQNITWDTTGLTAPVDIVLVPAGATDLTTVVETIVSGTANTGSYQWAPDSGVTIPNVEIIIVDAKQTIVISETFFIVIIEENIVWTSTTKKLSTTTKTSTKPTSVSTLKTTQTVLLIATTTTKASTSTKSTSSIKINTSLTTPAILVLSTSSTKLSTALGVATTTSKPMTTSSMSSIKVSTTSLANVTVLKQNATATTTTKAVFSGAANHESSHAYSLVSGGVIGLLAMFFL